MVGPTVRFGEKWLIIPILYLLPLLIWNTGHSGFSDSARGGNTSVLNATSRVLRAVGMREYLMIIRDNFCLFSIKTYVVTPHMNRLDETVQMRDRILVSELIKNIPQVSSNIPLI